MASKAKNQMYIGVKSKDVKKASHFAGIKKIKDVYSGKNFPGCSCPPVHLVTLDLSKFDCFSAEIQKMGKLPVVYSNCEACDAWMMEGEENDAEMYFKIKDHKLSPLNPKTYTDCCDEGESEPPEEYFGIDFIPYKDGDKAEWYAVYVGGEPKWVQGYDSWGVCPECEEAMDYVARVRAVRFGCGDQDLYIFVCTECSTMGMTMQCT